MRTIRPKNLEIQIEKISNLKVIATEKVSKIVYTLVRSFFSRNSKEIPENVLFASRNFQKFKPEFLFKRKVPDMCARKKFTVVHPNPQTSLIPPSLKDDCHEQALDCGTG